MADVSWGDKLKAFQADPQNPGLVSPAGWDQKLAVFQQGTAQTPVPEALPEATHWPVGATVGGIAGAVAGAPAGPGGSVALGAMGAAGGEALQQVAEHAVGSEAAPRTGLEAGGRIAKEFVFGSLSEIAGRGLQSGLMRLVQRETTPEGRQAISFAQQGMPRAGQPLADQAGLYSKEFLTPGEATGSSYQNVLNNLAEGSFLGGGVIKDFKSNRQKYLHDAIDKWSEQFGPSLPSKEVGEAIVGSIQKDYKLERAPARAIYGFLSQMTEPKPRIVYELEPTGLLDATGKAMMRKVPKEIIDKSSGAWADMRPLKAFAKKDKQMADFLNGIAAEEGGDTLLAKIVGMGDYIPYAAAQKLRTRLQSVADVYSVENKRAPALGLANRAGGMVDTAIDQGLARYSPDARDAWRYANDIYRGASEEFNNEFLRNLIKIGTRRKDGLPEKVFDEVWKPGAVSGIQKLKTALDPETWKLFQAQASQSLIQRSMKDGVLDFHQLERLAFDPKGIGNAAMRETFGTENLTWLHKFVDAGKLANRRAPEETGKMLIQLTQGGALFGLAAGILPGGSGVEAGAATIVLGPWLLGRLLTNPRTANALIDGLSTRTSAPVAGAIAGRLATALFPRTERREEPKLPITPRMTQVHTATPMAY